MVYEIRNATGETITLDGVSYPNGTWVNIVPYIAFQNIRYTRNDVDGLNAGRAINGKMIRDRVATKAKWEISLLGVITSDRVQAILKLIYPEVFYVRTDFPSGTITQFEVYSNNVPVEYSMLKPDGTEYYQSVKFPIVEM